MKPIFADDQKLSILFMTNGYPISSEPFIGRSAAELILRGHEVNILGMSNVTPTPASTGEATNKLLKGRTANLNWPTKWPARARSGIHAFLQIIRRKGLAGFQALRFDIYRRNLRDLSSLFQASELSIRAPCDVVHCQFATLSEYALKHRRAGLLDGAIVVHFRGYDITEVIQSYGPEVYDYAWADADHFIANCEAFKERAISLGCPADRITVVGTGIDLSFFPYSPPLLRAHNEPLRISMVGRLIERKGFHIALTALSELRKTYDYNFEITVIGDGPDRARLSQLATDLGLESKVRLMGRQPHETVREVLSSSHLFMAPSMTSAAGGEDAAVNTLKEAMALGVPVVATRHGGIPELVVDGQTGWLADENDSADLARAVADMIDNVATWQKTAEQARAIVEAKFDLPKMTRLQEDVYRRAIQHREASKKLIRASRWALFRSKKYGTNSYE